MSVLLTLVALAQLVSAAPVCEVANQFVLVSNEDSVHIKKCVSGVFGLSPSGYSAQELSELLEKNPTDPRLLAAFKELELGDSYGSAMAQLKSTEGLVTVYGDRDNQESLDYLSSKMNAQAGVTEALAALRERQESEKAEKMKRDSTPVALNADKLEQMAKNNSAIASELKTDSCAKARGKDIELQVLRVNFADGEKAILLPHAVKKLGANRFSVTMQIYGTVFGGQQVGAGVTERILKIENGKFIWGGADGKEYPVSSFTQLTSSEALGIARPLGFGKPQEACLWARHFNDSPSKAPGAAADASAAAARKE